MTFWMSVAPGRDKEFETTNVLEAHVVITTEHHFIQIVCLCLTMTRVVSRRGKRLFVIRFPRSIRRQVVACFLSQNPDYPFLVFLLSTNNTLCPTMNKIQESATHERGKTQLTFRIVLYSGQPRALSKPLPGIEEPCLRRRDEAHDHCSGLGR